jgi:hypothetical protein
MNEQQKENLKLGIKALRENPLKAKDQMRDSSGGRCCLCVLSEVAEDIQGVPRGTFTYREPDGEDAIVPTSDLAEIFGLHNEFISEQFNFLINHKMASIWNDGLGFTPELSHKEIADMIEKEFLS